MAEEVEVKDKKKGLSSKASKIANIIVDVVVVIILALAALLAVCAIQSKKSGLSNYTKVFNHAYLAVASESMDNDDYEVPAGKLSGFKKGDLIKIRIISDDAKRTLQIGDVISFAADIDGDGVKNEINTHRIVDYVGTEGSASGYYTKGDNNSAQDAGFRTLEDIIGVYEGKASGIGNVFLFMSSSTGFFVCIVLPTLLVVVYCVINLILVVSKEKKVQGAAAEEARIKEREEDRERIRQELLAEMNGANAPPAEQNTETAPAQAEDTPDVNRETESVEAEETADNNNEPESSTEVTQDKKDGE